MSESKIEGVIKNWNSERGFGFVEVGDYPDTADFFLHISSCLNGYIPSQGDCVEFSLKKDSRKGTTVASQVKPTGYSIDCDYFSRENRQEIRARIREEKREAEYQFKERYKERYMESESFKNSFSYERKEGYSCRNCGRELDERKMSCNC